MLIFSCSDQKILSRWKSAMTNFDKLLTINHFSILRNKLRNMTNASVILHTSLPGLKSNGDIIKLIEDFPSIRLLILADIPDEHQGIELIRSGILGYANTQIKPDILREAIKIIQLGEVWVSKRMLHWMVNHCNDINKSNDTGSFHALDSLTPSELHVATSIAEGNNNKQIARILEITERTVKAHLTSIYKKTGVKDRLHLALLIHQNSVA